MYLLFVFSQMLYYKSIRKTITEVINSASSYIQLLPTKKELLMVCVESKC